MTPLPSYIDPEIWSAFVDARKANKSPMTQQAQKLMIMRCMRLYGEGWDINEALTDATINNWKSLYPKQKRDRPKDAKDPALEKIERDAKTVKPMNPEIQQQLRDLFKVKA
jgi:hypothetical protein